MYPVQDVAKKALGLVSGSTNQIMIGARLGALLKTEFPDFSPILYKSKNLRQFVRAHVPALTEQSHSRLDVVYAVREQNQPSLQPAVPEVPASSLPSFDYVRLPTTLFNWRAYSNPSNPSLLTVNTETGELQVVDRNAPLAAPWIVIPKPSAEFHRKVAVEFVSGLSEPSKAQLARVLEDPTWYRQFSSVAKRLNEGSRWAAFRITQLTAEFAKTLAGNGIPLQETQRFAPRPSTGTQESSATVVFASDETNLRDLALKLVAILPIDELRSLRLPLGFVLDSLQKK